MDAVTSGWAWAGAWPLVSGVAPQRERARGRTGGESDTGPERRQQRVPDLLVEQLAPGELSSARAAEVRARLLELGDQHGVQATALAALAARLPPLEADGC